jgi:subtilase family serine protease
MTLAKTAVPAVARQHPLGVVAKTSRISFEVVLQLRDAAGAAALVRDVSSPGSRDYRRYVTTKQWEAMFSPTAKEVDAARSWLKSEGFAVGTTSKDRITVTATGTAAQVERAFDTGLKYYRFLGNDVRFATGNLSVPAAMAHTVAGAIGVNQEFAQPYTSSAGATSATQVKPRTSPWEPAPSSFTPSPPCSSYFGQKSTTVTPAFGHGYPSTVPDEVCGYVGTQLRSAYGLTSSETGKGETVAIIDAYGTATIASDATHFFKTEDPAEPFSSSQLGQDDAFPFDDQAECGNWGIEQDLDVESVHSMAPDANILYVGAQDCANGLFNAEQSVIDDELAPVVTNSWGYTGGDLLEDISTRTAYDDIFMLADSTGMSILFSSGDDGDNFEVFGVSTADYPASSPFVTGVGGTSLEIGKKGAQTEQYGWMTGRSFKCSANVEGIFSGCAKATVGKWLPVTFDGGGGGFTSYNYVQPWYQAPVVPSSLSLRNQPIIGPTPARVVPDISMDADASTGLLMGLHMTYPSGKVKYGLTRYGGTSLASPLLAGVLADVNQASLDSGGSYVGFINPAIYKLVDSSGAIDDIRSPSSPAGMYRVDFAASYGGSSGTVSQYREVAWRGHEVYCDETGNCETRPMTEIAFKGYDSLTGLGSIGPNFVTDFSRI